MILSLRDKGLAHHDCARLRRFGVPAMGCPVHHARAVDFDKRVLAQAAGFILTSQQAAIGLPKGDAEFGRPVFCVGRASAVAARAAGYKDVRFGPSDGAALAQMIAREARGLSLLWLRGRMISFDMKAALPEQVSEAIIYEMVEEDEMALSVREAIKAGDISGIMALSKAQLAGFERLVARYDLAAMAKEIPLFVVSGAVARAAASSGWKIVDVARRKRALSVQAAVICHYHRQRGHRG